MAPAYRIEHEIPALGYAVNIGCCSSAMAAVQHAAATYTWARGYPDHDLGVIWPFNPLMLVNGRPAYEIAAEEIGGDFADAAARKADLRRAA